MRVADQKKYIDYLLNKKFVLPALEEDVKKEFNSEIDDITKLNIVMMDHFMN